MTSFLSSLFGRGSTGSATAAGNITKVALITNFSACSLGLRLLDRLSQAAVEGSNTKVIAVSHDASRFEDRIAAADKDKVIMFEAFPNEQEDRNRLISFLLQNKMQVSTLVQN